MSTVRHLLSSGSFTQDWTNAGLITVNDNWDNVPSIMGYRGDDVVTATGVDPRNITAAGTSGGVVDVNANQSNPNTFTTGGVTEFDGLTDRVVALTGSGTADAPSLVFFLDSTGRENVRFQAQIRDIESGPDNAIQQVAVQWRVGEGNWNNIAYIADATVGNGTQSTAVDVTLPAGASNSSTLEIRVITTNAIGNDEWVGLDDIVVTSSPAAADTTAPTLAGFNPTDPDDNAVAVDPAENIVLRFSEAVRAGSGSFTLSNGTDVRTIAVTDAQVTISGTTVTINPTTDLVGGSTYTLTAPAGIVEDLAGNDYAGLPAGALDFTTLSQNPIAIGAIQGLGHRSGFVNTQVRTEGVVTAIDTNGYYLQSALGASDGDARTSDGIFVFTNTAPTGIAKGELIRIQATVGEFLPGNDSRNLTVTQLTSPTILARLGTANVETVVIGEGGLRPPTSVIDDDGLTSYDPATDGIDFYESLEGMLVKVDAPLVVSNTNGRNETFVVASGGAGATGVSNAGGITISEGDFNPERIQLDDDSGLFAGFTGGFTVGDRLSDVTGVMSYSFQSYELLVTQAVTVTEDRTLEREFTNLVEADDKLSVASFNLENLAATDSADKFYALAADIVFNLNAPDIIAGQEIQDGNGTQAGGSTSGVPSANALIQAILDLGGPEYAYAEIAPANNTTGGAPNGNIRNGFFYDPARVTLVEGSLQLIDGPAYGGTRRPLTASFEFNGETVTLVNVHSTSRLGSDALFGANQPPADAGDAARTAQGQGVRNWIDAKLAVDPAAKIAVLGDFNGFTWENQIKALTNGGRLQDLGNLLPQEERYSYNFEGNNQLLDHIVATNNLVAVAEFDIVHLNADQPDALKSTDHDGLLAVFQLGGGQTGQALAFAPVLEPMPTPFAEFGRDAYAQHWVAMA